MSGSTQMYHGTRNTIADAQKKINETHSDGNRHERRKQASRKRKAKKIVQKMLRGGIGNEYSLKPNPSTLI